MTLEEYAKRSTCKKCGAAIIWIDTPRGKKMPADRQAVAYKANPKGKERVVNLRGEVIACDLTFPGAADGMARVPHWATCPNADEFRRR